ncbi:MAG: serine protease [Micavibrio sp.]|nr:serine protease [Micavibrio sp.]|tara:strand:- start:1370 stop:2797 length:1428 start_codon:yes stop_codon:yes gene_type:complete
MERVLYKIAVFTVCLVVTFGVAVRSYANERTVPQNKAQIQYSYAPIVKKVSPAVVNIYTKKKVVRRVGHPFFSDPFFSNFFDGGMMRERVESTLGSGFIVNANGLVVTNAHVIKGAEEAKVDLSDGRQFEAETILVDEASDIALMQLDAKEQELPFVEFESSEGLEVGDIVLAIGNPFGVGQTVTSGIVSAVARAASTVSDFNFFIQTDAAINPGNSGGPLVSLSGKVVGVNTAIYSRDGGSLGIGFAVPSEMAQSVIAAVQTGQYSERGVVRAWVGAQGQSITQDIAQSLDLDSTRGVLISDVHPLSPAGKAGLKQGDVVLRMNGKDVRDGQELLFRFATLALGERVELDTLRRGQPRTVIFKAIAPVEEPPRNETALTGTHPLNGVRVINVSPAVEIEYDLKKHSSGVIISAVDRNRTFSAIALRPGDGIIKVNDTEIKSVDNLEKTLKKGADSGHWSIVIRRSGQDQLIVIR